MDFDLNEESIDIVFHSCMHELDLNMDALNFSDENKNENVNKSENKNKDEMMLINWLIMPNS